MALKSRDSERLSPAGRAGVRLASGTGLQLEALNAGLRKPPVASPIFSLASRQKCGTRIFLYFFSRFVPLFL